MTREEAIKILKAIRVYECYPKSASEETKEAIDMAIEALSAEAVPGEWIRVGHDIYECSLCHQNVMTRDIDCYAYCHRCGARMFGEDREVSGWLKEYFPSDEDYDYERAVDQMDHDVVYEPTYNPEDGSI